MDVGKIGDSETATASISTAALHDKRSVQDVGIGIDWLTHAGHVKTTVVGICSGAYLAFHAVSDHPSASGAVLINLRQYTWSEGQEHVSNPAVASTAVYMESIRSMAKWSSLLSGKTKWRPIVKGLVARRIQRWKDTATYLLSGLTHLDTPTRLVRRKLQVLAQRGAKMQFIYGAFDEGREQAELLLGKDFYWLHCLPNMRAITERSMDHALFLYPARELLTRAVEAHIGLTAIANAPETVIVEYVTSPVVPLRHLADGLPKTL
jgi:pimeloyl-ACP methyl ester carboxylesterase